MPCTASADLIPADADSPQLDVPSKGQVTACPSHFTPGEPRETLHLVREPEVMLGSEHLGAGQPEAILGSEHLGLGQPEVALKSLTLKRCAQGAGTLAGVEENTFLNYFHLEVTLLGSRSAVISGPRRTVDQLRGKVTC